MAKVQSSARRLSNGQFRGTAYIKLSCDHEIRETHTAEKEKHAKQGAEDLAKIAAKGHIATRQNKS